MKRLVSLAALAAAITVAGCSKKAEPEQLPPPPATVETAAPRPTPTPTGPVPGSNADFMAQMQGRSVIFFDTDKFDIDADDQAALRAQAQWLQRYPAKRATIEGHCDERGTREYNIALGERRANAAKNYLVSLGVDASRINTVSYGKERPVALGSNEAAWAQNRRAATITID
ncbi:peptidoglycan-associated lipoprotein Pal [Altererythrobacter sp. CC-YST694]|uniref:peptidoglycan-associated lipoprotein Pal n=1 Tax=Altererythrobacter sp. CC-YST694 TaxID=2755038 RepID=UPI001D0355F1|nr:peptidoglycan-associated lipoprotein Pal [Altererythrobacter sp. CC-YST694]MCB5425902.1 peptidoglycan-associated lipoprotein Pal [Altererythrobacter sp. CC-YST694]